MHTDTTVIENLMGNMLITSSPWTNTMGSSVGGIGLMLSKRAYSSLSGIESFNSRIRIAHFNGNPVTTIVVAYSPTEAATTQEAEDYQM